MQLQVVRVDGDDERCCTAAVKPLAFRSNTCLALSMTHSVCCQRTGQLGLICASCFPTTRGTQPSLRAFGSYCRAHRIIACSPICPQLCLLPAEWGACPTAGGAAHNPRPA